MLPSQIARACAARLVASRCYARALSMLGCSVGQLRCSAAGAGKSSEGSSTRADLCCHKVGRYGADTFDFSAERVTKSVHESLERLQVRSRVTYRGCLCGHASHKQLQSCC